MNKTTRILFIIFAVVLAVQAGLSVAFIYEVYDLTDELRYVETGDMLSMRALLDKAEDRIAQLEKEVAVVQAGMDDPVSPDTPVYNSCHDCHHSDPGTEDAPTVYCTLRTYNDLIGVFDQENKLIRVINVYYRSLPKADQEALEQGITVSSPNELLDMMDIYS